LLPSEREWTIPELFEAKVSDLFVTATGMVRRHLSDDNIGSRHQRFLVMVGEVCVLMAHNIDLAERVPCDVGDIIEFRGEYEWTEQGGTIHWTHHDPGTGREVGWIEHRGVRYR